MSDFVVRAIHPSEIEAVSDLVSICFSTENHHTHSHQRFSKRLLQRPGFKLEHMRAGFLHGALIAFARIANYTLHYGRAQLRVMGIASVCTHPDFRRRGYSAQILRDVLMLAAEQGAHLALLNGIPHYYDRFGFMPVWPNYTLTAPAERAAQLEPTLNLRDACDDDLPYIAQLYNKHWGARVTFSRSPALWQWRIYAGDQHLVVAVDTAGQLRGYVWHQNDQQFFAPREVIADSAEAVQTLLSYDGRYCRQHGQDNLVWSVPPDDLIVPHTQQLLPVTLSAHYAPTGSWMGRMIDSKAVIQTLLPEITAQAQALSQEFDTQQLLISMQSDGVDISLRGYPNSACYLSLRDFIQIVFGSLRPATLALRQNLHPEAVELLELLFPSRIAAIAPWDWY